MDECDARSAFCKPKQIRAQILENEQIECLLESPMRKELLDQVMYKTYDFATDTLSTNCVNTRTSCLVVRVQFTAAP